MTNTINKAGIIPYYRDERGLHLFVMKPRADHPDLPPPPFQIAKGTRMMKVGGEWVDMKEVVEGAPLEPLDETALREGEEEIGLKRENVAELFDLGVAEFTSASKGTTKQMQLFAARVLDPDNFLGDTKIADTTSERCWLLWPADQGLLRADHAESITKALPLIP